MKRIRTLRPDEIEVRQQGKPVDGKQTVLLYIDSRAVVKLLDETYGPENWTIEYKPVNDQIYGRLSIYDENTQRWVHREDTGSESNIEAQKGLSSDILKRCIARFGVTELYSTPKIKIQEDKYGYAGYKVGYINYDDNRNVTDFNILNRFGKEVYSWCRNDTPGAVQNARPEPQSTSTDEHKQRIIQSIRDNARLIMTPYNMSQVTEFGKYWVAKIEKSGWRYDDFNFQRYWEEWQRSHPAIS